MVLRLHCGAGPRLEPPRHDQCLRGQEEESAGAGGKQLERAGEDAPELPLGHPQEAQPGQLSTGLLLLLVQLNQEVHHQAHPLHRRLQALQRTRDAQAVLEDQEDTLRRERNRTSSLT